jgi:Flp pilus assembly pilin Flp
MYVEFSFLPSRLKRFARQESGAVTVDWVVLTAAIVGLGLAVIGVLRTAYEPNSTNIGTELQEISINRSF